MSSRLLQGFAALVSGALFGGGLALSGMTEPRKVIGFLDIAGAWDPSLALVMAAAIAVHATAYRLIRRRPAPLLADNFAIPGRRDLDARLVLGAAIFGAGWGLAGYCPGPGIVAASSGGASAVVFVSAMVLGTLLTARGESALRDRPRTPGTEAAKAT